MRSLRRYYRRNPDFGDMPPHLFETLRVVDPHSPEGEAFQSYMESFYKRLFPGQRPKPVRFIMTDEKQLNAFFLTGHRPPVLGFSKRLLLTTKYLEDVLGIMAHELTHKRFEDEYGKHNNSKLEELAADAYPLILLADADLDPREYVRYVKANIHTDTKETYHEILIDVHPTAPNRVRVLEDALAILDQKRGGFYHISPTLLPEEFQRLIESCRHQSFVDLFVKKTGFTELSNVEKLKLLQEFLPGVEEWNRRRLLDMAELLGSFKVKRSVLEEAREQDALANIILDLQTRSQSYPWPDMDPDTDTILTLYRSLVSRLSAEGVRPIGRLKAYEDAIYGLLEATNKGAALEASAELLALLEKEPLKLNLLARLATWPQFKLPTFVGKSLISKKPVSWNKQVEWAERDNSQTIARALMALGIVDQRLFKFLDLEIEFREGQLLKLFRPVVIEEVPEEESYGADLITIDQCEVDDNGYLHLPKKKQEQRIETIRKEEDAEILEKNLQRLEKWFLAIRPGDVQEEERLLEERQRVIGGEDKIQPRWLGLGHAEKNFPLFIQLNQNMLTQLGQGNPKTSPSLLFARELFEIAGGLDDSAESGVIRETIRGLFLGFPAKSPLYQLSFSQKFVSLDFPCFQDSNPISQIILLNPGRLFSHEEQLQLLDKTAVDVEYHYRSPDSLSSASMDEVRRLLRYRQPKTGAGFSAVIDKLREGGRFAKAMLLVEFRLLLHLTGQKEHGRALRGNWRYTLPAGLDIDKVIEVADDLEISNSEELKSLLRPVVAKKSWPTGIQPLIDAWVGASNADLFPVDQVLCYRLLQRITQRIGQIKSPSQQIVLFERILFNHRIKDPKIRNQMEERWAAATLRLYGIDNNSLKYSNTLRPLLQRLGGTQLDTRMSLSDKLANRLQTQARLTSELKNLVQNISKEQLESSFLKGIAIEAAILKTRKSPRGRNALMDYLLQPLTDKTAEDMARVVEEEAINELQSTIGDVVLGTSRTSRVPRVQVLAELKFMWENFWAAPFGVRAVLFEQLLFPTISYDPTESKQIADSVFQHVCDKLFPLQEPYSREARYFLEAYFFVIPEYQYRILLSAMMVTAEKSSESALSIGQRLAMVLELLGPAETKLGQIIHSHPQTPMEIKQGMGRLKSRADPPFRWDLIEYIGEVIPSSFKKRIRHIGSLLGSASFYLAVELYLKDGTSGVLKLLRPHARKRAQNGFRIMMSMLEVLKKNFSPEALTTLRQMIAQAEQSAVQESDEAISLQQASYATSIYDGRKVEIGSIKIEMHVCKVLEAGPNYQLIQLAPGKHFNDLPEKTEEQRLHKEQIALAYYAFELSSILRGRRFDNDRHGAQLRIEGNDIYLFDWGGMLLQDPTPQQLNQLGETLFHFGMALQLGTAPETAIFQSVQDRANQGEDVSYLLDVQRAMLALEDFRQYISTPTLVTLLRSFMSANVIHPDILNGLMVKAMGQGLDLSQMQEMFLTGETLPIRILRRR